MQINPMTFTVTVVQPQSKVFTGEIEGKRWKRDYREINWCCDTNCWFAFLYLKFINIANNYIFRCTSCAHGNIAEQRGKSYWTACLYSKVIFSH